MSTKDDVIETELPRAWPHYKPRSDEIDYATIAKGAGYASSHHFDDLEEFGTWVRLGYTRSRGVPDLGQDGCSRSAAKVPTIEIAGLQPRTRAGAAPPVQLNGPSGLAFDGDDDLYVVDSRTDHVHKFTKDGQLLMSWGGSGRGEGQFDRPWGIAISREGEVFVADWGNDRVQKFAPDGSFLMAFWLIRRGTRRSRSPG